MSKRKVHIYTVTDLARSVLYGRKARALCGRERVLAREDLESGAVGCMECIKRAHATGTLPSLVMPRPWVETLEAAFKIIDGMPVYTATIRTTTSGSTHSTTTLPIAG